MKKERKETAGKRKAAPEAAAAILVRELPTVWTLKAMAERWRKHNAWRQGKPPYDKPGCEATLTAGELGTLTDRTIQVLEAVAKAKAAAETPRAEGARKA